MWKVYLRENLYHISQASTSYLYTALGTYSENHDADYTPKAYDGNNII